MAWILKLITPEIIGSTVTWMLDRLLGNSPSKPSVKAMALAEARQITNVNLDPLIHTLGRRDDILEATMRLLGKFHAAGLIATAISTTLNIFMGQSAIRELKKMAVQLERIA